MKHTPRSYRWIPGVDESGNWFVIQQRSRWDFVDGKGWTLGWETLLNTIRYR